MFLDEKVCPVARGQIDRHTHRQTDTHTDKQTDRQTDRQTDLEVCPADVVKREDPGS